jgi:ADP-heptose:LPS heptosyltransferase
MNERLLYLVPARLGDAVMLTPALARLKQLRPQHHIDILAATAMSASVYRNNPNCGTVYVYPQTSFSEDFIDRYDFLVAAHRDVKIVEMSERCRKPIVLTELKDAGQVQAQQTLRFIDRMFGGHDVSYELTGYQLYPAQAEFDYVSHLLGDGSLRYVGLHLGCHGINRRRGLIPWRKKTQHEKIWPLKRYVAFAHRFREQHAQYRFVLTGGDNEQHLAHEFAKRVPDTLNLVGKTDVLQLAALMQRLSAYICGDTGAMHVACAMKVPLVALFGPTNMLRTGPYPPASFRHVIKSADLAELSPHTVLQAIDGLLESTLPKL